jgi:hypothetical protein
VSSPLIRQVDTVADLDGRPLAVGVDHGHVTVGAVRVSAEQADRLAELLILAMWQAERDAAAIEAALAGLPGPDDAGYGWRREQLLEDAEAPLAVPQEISRG